ncbi:hypothetical protein BaRGS_00004107 [Batillaria attramentaria]|uniref:Uncharacterized protein n=1 Tax=Batillaria attramentaria TaxID=370345 RepID=A0ABD0LZD4_9CAEN
MPHHPYRSISNSLLLPDVCLGPTSQRTRMRRQDDRHARAITTSQKNSAMLFKRTIKWRYCRIVPREETSMHAHSGARTLISHAYLVMFYRVDNYREHVFI